MGGYIKSPLNYTGGKYKLLNDLFHLFPNKIDTFVDLFCGGLNVGINMKTNRILCNDRMEPLIKMYEYISQTQSHDLIEQVENVIEQYNLKNKDLGRYYDLRSDYNRSGHPLCLLVLTFYSFNHKMRFNSKGEFNISYAKHKVKYNDNIKRNLILFCDEMKNKNITFLNDDFLNIDLTHLNKSDFVYCDPPYLISKGGYEFGGENGWSNERELSLLSYLKDLNRRDIRFALSNVIEHKGERNEILIDWMKDFNVHFLNVSYNNCSHNRKKKDELTQEVLITNY